MTGHCALSRIASRHVEKKMSGYEINFDGLVGPTHHYAGLSFGNFESTKNRNNA